VSLQVSRRRWEKSRVESERVAKHAGGGEPAEISLAAPPRGVPSPARGARTLRVSVTDRCDLRCRYCMPAGAPDLAPREDLPTLEETAGVVSWLAARLGLERIKLTGGEPLVRRGIPSLVRMLAAIPGVCEVSMTSNGTRLAGQARALRAAGLARVNVSLDTLDPVRYRRLTRGGDVRRVLDGIAAARDAGLAPVKLNAVLRASAWREDVPALLDFASGNRLEIRFIELMRTGTQAAWAAGELIEAAEVRAWLEERATLRRLPARVAAPARRTLVRWRGRDVSVGWITPVSHPFCAACDRLRLDARGRLLRCLMEPLPLALLALLRDGRDAVAEEAVARYLAGKRPPAAMGSGQAMRAIGG
jgi:GTP 3',8-cyclase